ncbi:MAG TPA: hypothetical protein VHX65_18810 [Pirellulales bacterium]|nr:hypothetical protein [Pirellulales bacterium]
MDRRKLHEMIDACRPGSADIELSEVAPLAAQAADDAALQLRYDRTQQLDARLAGAFAAVEIPAGLHERILAGARGEGRGPSEEEACQGRASEGATCLANGMRLGSAVGARRARWKVLVAAAAGLLLVLAGHAFWPRHPSLTYDRLLDLSAEWFARLQSHPSWQPLPPHAVVRDFPVADAIRPQPQHWQDVSALVGEAACAYDLSANGRRAVLFVIADDGPIAGSPFKPGSSTGGLTIGCWQSARLVYVLVVEGDERAYRGLLDDSSPPLARFMGPMAPGRFAGNLLLAYHGG